ALRARRGAGRDKSHRREGAPDRRGHPQGPHRHRPSLRTAATAHHGGTMSLPGVDISSFQGPPASWKTVAGKIRWGGVKITELQPGGVRYVNPDAAADWAFLGQQKMGRIAYLFGPPAVSAADSVAFFAAELASLGLDDADAV